MIAEISPQANRAKATVQVKVQILNPDAYLRPDMNATVKFLADESKQYELAAAGRFCAHRCDSRSRWQEDRLPRV